MLATHRESPTLAISNLRERPSNRTVRAVDPLVSASCGGGMGSGSVGVVPARYRQRGQVDVSCESHKRVSIHPLWLRCQCE